MHRLLGGACAMVFVLVAGGFGQDWNGFYVGGNAGGVKGKSDVFTSTIFSPTGYFAMSSVPAIAAVGHTGLSPRGFTGGGQVGYNLQRGHWVLGVEADFGSMHVNDDFTATGVYPCCAPSIFTITQKVSSDWLFTARPRVGVGNANVLVYGTGGLAMTNFNYSENFIDNFPQPSPPQAGAHEFASTSGTLTGWTGGGGVEFKTAAGSRWSVKAEYLYADFGSGVKTTSTNLTAFTPTISFPTNVFTHQADLTQHIFRGGFNYRF